MNPEITVLMSVYNSSTYLKDSINSILNQTFQNFEFLIINDGSTDNSLEILNSFSDNRIKIITNYENIGLTKSLNKGLEFSKGKYIARMDSDDISNHDRLEKEYRVLENNQNLAVVGSFYEVIDLEGKVIIKNKLLKYNDEIKTGLFRRNQFAHGSVIFRKEYINKTGNYRNYFKFSQDYDLWLRISEYYEISNIPEYLYKWRLIFDSASLKNQSEQKYYADLALTMAIERKLTGKDRLHNISEAKYNNIDSLPVVINHTVTRKDLSSSHLYWGKQILFKGTKVSKSIPWFLKSIYYDLFNITAYYLLFLSILYILLPERYIELLKKLKGFVHRLIYKS